MFADKMFRSPSLMAGLSIRQPRIAISFLSLTNPDVCKASYVGNLQWVQNIETGGIIRVPEDIPESLREGYRLVELMKQMPEMNDTKHIAYECDGILFGSWVLDRFLENRGIAVEDVSSVLRNISSLSIYSDDDLMQRSIAVAKAYEDKKQVNSWLKKNGY
jgi:hypothetical protein